MRVSVVSDIHGNFDDLARVADSAESLIVLGDLLNYVDYHNPASGILGMIFGTQAVTQLRQYRIAGDFHQYHDFDRKLWSTLSDPEAALNEAVVAQYEKAIDALGTNTYLTLGNVDVPEVWKSLAPPHLRMIDGTAIEIGHVSVGFIGGGATKTPPNGSPWQSFDRTYEQYRAKIAALPPVDILCSHLPPDLVDMRYDTTARRAEMYGPGLLEYVQLHQPAYALSGHIHNPRETEGRVGRTHCINVGHFQRTSEPYELDLRDIV